MSNCIFLFQTNFSNSSSDLRLPIIEPKPFKNDSFCLAEISLNRVRFSNFFGIYFAQCILFIE